MLEYIKRAKRGEAGVAEKLRESFVTWAGLAEAAYGTLDRIPKFHFSQHLWEQLEIDGFIVDCFVTERVNSTWIQAAKTVENTKQFEKSVALRSLNMHLSKLCNLRRDGLFSDKPCPALGVDAYVSVCMQWQRCRLYADDVIFLNDSEALLIVACARFGTELAIVASVLAEHERLTGGACLYERTAPQVVPLAGSVVRLPSAWRYRDNGFLVVVD